MSKQITGVILDSDAMDDSLSFSILSNFSTLQISS